MYKNFKLFSNRKLFLRWDIINVILFFIVILIFVLMYLINTTLIMYKLIDREKSNYEIYLNEDFEEYSQNSEILDSKLEDLGRWNDQGVISAWTYIPNRDNVDRIDLKLTDSSG